MARFSAFGEDAYWNGVRRLIEKDRTTILVAEHEDADLPADILQSDGTLDLYDDVQTRFEIAYRRRTGKLSIRGGGWVGYVPINDRYTLSIEPRVPVSNLERVLARSTDVQVDILDNYSRVYGHTDDRPQALYDVVTDQFLEALDGIWREGLLKVYRRATLCGAMPFGRIDPYGTELLVSRTRKSTAMFSAFVRTDDCMANRLLKSAANRLLRWYEGIGNRREHGRRIQRLLDAHSRLQAVELSGPGFHIGPGGVEKIIGQLPSRQLTYAGALRLAAIIVKEWGIKVTGTGGVAVLPVVLVDMADVFEKYARQVLKQAAIDSNVVEVWDGNVAAPTGARTGLFEEFDIDGRSPAATPDIVVTHDGAVSAVIDVKYKPGRVVPERADINQVVTYAVRYGCERAMVLYPDAAGGRGPVVLIGRIGGIQVYRGGLDIGTSDIVLEERRSTAAVLKTLGGDASHQELSTSGAAV